MRELRPAACGDLTPRVCVRLGAMAFLTAFTHTAFLYFLSLLSQAADFFLQRLDETIEKAFSTQLNFLVHNIAHRK